MEATMINFSFEIPTLRGVGKWTPGIWIPAPTWKQRMPEHLAIYYRLERHGA